jgi:hypothetical protein
VPAPTAQALAKARQITRMQDMTRLSSTRFNSALTSSVGLLVRQNLQLIDPDNQLQGQALSTVSKTMTRDIRATVTRAFQSINLNQLSSSLSTSYARQLSGQDLDSLLAYYHSEQGQRYLAFSTELNATLGDGLNQLGTQPFSYTRAQQPDSTLLANRRALISMSSIGLQLRAANAAGLVKPSGAAFGLITEFMSMGSGDVLDRINQHFAKDLPAFNAFQHSPAAMHQALAEWQWTEQSATLFAPALEQATRDLAAYQKKWRAQADQLLTQQASAAH